MRSGGQRIATREQADSPKCEIGSGSLLFFGGKKRRRREENVRIDGRHDVFEAIILGHQRAQIYDFVAQHAGEAPKLERQVIEGDVELMT